MDLWIGLALLTALAAFAVTGPLLRAGSRPAPGGNDAAVYRDQLAEIIRDRDSGLIGPAEAEAARAEVARRLLKVSRADTGPAGGLSVAARRLIAALLLILMPGAAIGLYAHLGQPGIPDQPLAERSQKPGGRVSAEEMIARAEAKLVANPDDGEGWDVIARVYYRITRYDDAATAARNAIRLLGSSPERQMLLGRSVFDANQGVVTKDAREAFEAVLTLDPGNVLARMFLAHGLAQDGNTAAALAAWRALKDGATGGEDWIGVVDEQIARLEGRPVPPKDPPQAGAADGADADQQKAMIAGMVTRLAERLDTSGGTAEDWSRLMLSYKVLGRDDDARAALAKARVALKDDAAALAALADAAKKLGL